MSGKINKTKNNVIKILKKLIFFFMNLVKKYYENKNHIKFLNLLNFE